MNPLAGKKQAAVVPRPRSRRGSLLNRKGGTVLPFRARIGHQRLAGQGLSDVPPSSPAQPLRPRLPAGGPDVQHCPDFVIHSPTPHPRGPSLTIARSPGSLNDDNELVDARCRRVRVGRDPKQGAEPVFDAAWALATLAEPGRAAGVPIGTELPRRTR